MKTLSNIALAMSVALASPVGLAFAQTGGDPSSNEIRDQIRRGAQIEDALKSVQRQRGTDADGAVIDGEGGVYLLERADIFSVGALASLGYDSNPLRQIDSNSSSFYGSTTLFAGIDTRVGNSVDVGFSVTANLNEFIDEQGPDGRSLVASVYASKAFWRERIIMSLSSFAGINTDGSFKNDASFYGFSLSASSLIPISQQLFIRPVVSINRQLSGISEQDTWALSARSDAIYQFNRRWRAGAYVNYSHRIFDNFFEDVTLVSRNDDLIQVGGSASYQLTPRANLTLATSYTKQFSTFFLSEFQAVGIDLTGRFELRF